MVEIDPYYHELQIEDERNSIKFYARSIGVWKAMLEKTTADTSDFIIGMLNYYLTLDETYMENVNENLKQLRKELADYRLQHPELRELYGGGSGSNVVRAPGQARCGQAGAARPRYEQTARA